MTIMFQYRGISRYYEISDPESASAAIKQARALLVKDLMADNKDATAPKWKWTIL